MTKLMSELVAEITQMPEPQQDEWAAYVLAELRDEQRWDERFAQTRPELDALEARVRDEMRDGKFIEFNPDEM